MRAGCDIITRGIWCHIPLGHTIDAQILISAEGTSGCWGLILVKFFLLYQQVRDQKSQNKTWEHRMHFASSKMTAMMIKQFYPKAHKSNEELRWHTGRTVLLWSHTHSASESSKWVCLLRCWLQANNWLSLPLTLLLLPLKLTLHQLVAYTDTKYQKHIHYRFSRKLGFLLNINPQL